VGVDDVGQLLARFRGLLQTRQNSERFHQRTQTPLQLSFIHEAGTYSDGLAGSMMTASFVLSSVTKSDKIKVRQHARRENANPPIEGSRRYKTRLQA
jgi:hypothetical protein